MLPRCERLTTREFSLVFERGRNLRGALLQLRLWKRDESASAPTMPTMETRAAFVVGKKLGKATVRNHLRRRAREVYRLSDWRTDVRLAGCDLIFLLSAGALDAGHDELQAALDEILERAVREGVARVGIAGKQRSGVSRSRTSGATETNRVARRTFVSSRPQHEHSPGELSLNQLAPNQLTPGEGSLDGLSQPGQMQREDSLAAGSGSPIAREAPVLDATPTFDAARAEPTAAEPTRVEHNCDQ